MLSTVVMKAGVLLAMLALVAAAAGCRSHRPGIVSWANRPLPLYLAPEPKPVRLPTSAPPCRAGRLRVTQGRDGVGLGNRLEELVFHNIGSTPCLLRGYPTITGVTSDGVRRRLRPMRGGTYFGSLVPADMPPGGRTFLDIATSAGCDGGNRIGVTYRHLVFGLPQGGRVRAGEVSITEVCGLSISTFGLPPRLVPEPRAASGTVGTLRIRLRLPGTVRAGTTLRYVVVLANPTPTRVSLDPCPGYTQGMYAGGPVGHGSFALNCYSVQTIPAHGRIRYAMELEVPERAARGPAKVGWSLDTPLGPYAGGVVVVTS